MLFLAIFSDANWPGAGLPAVELVIARPFLPDAHRTRAILGHDEGGGARSGCWYGSRTTHQALALMWCCSSFGVEWVGVPPTSHLADLFSVTPILRVRPQNPFPPTTRQGLEKVGPETVVGKLDYSQTPSVSSGSTLRARAEVRIAARRHEFPGLLTRQERDGVPRPSLKAGPTSGPIRPLRAPGPRGGWRRTRGARRGFARRDAPRKSPEIPDPPPPPPPHPPPADPRRPKTGGWPRGPTWGGGGAPPSDSLFPCQAKPPGKQPFLQTPC
eukprot:gene13431-biopygen12555